MIFRALTAFALFLSLIAAAPAPAQEARDLARISAYLNGIDTMTGSFVQVDPDGVLSEGKFYISRPGRIRFEYRDPNPALVISDGFWVGVIDKRYNSVDRYPLSDTPLHLILQKNVNLAKEGAVTGLERREGQMRVTAIDPSHPERGSIVLVFSDNPLELRQWIVEDAQGGLTTVALSETKRGVRVPPELFVIPDNPQEEGNR